MSMRDKIEHAIQNQPCTVKELKQKFGGERGADRKVMEALDELVREAVVCQRQGVFFTVRSGRADKALLCKVVKLGKNFAFVMLEDGTSDIFIPGRFTKGAMPGDEVLVEKFEHPRMEGSDEGTILAVLTEKNDLVGTVRRVEGRLRFVPDDCPAITMPLARDCEGGAKDGDKVAVEILNRGNRQEDHRVGVAMRFGSSDEAKRCAKALLYAKDIRTRFPDKVREEAKKFEGAEISEKDCEGRMDLRALPIFTIDSAETKDIDDAVSLTRTSDGGFELGVHIADVSNYVKPGTELDNEAFSRATSVYYADQVVPMLPKALSNGICSLNENELRLAFSCLMRLDKDGNLTDYRFVKSIIRSRVKGVYAEINALLAGTADAEIKAKYADVIDQLPAMKELYGHRARLRKERGCMDIESGEVKLILDENGRCIDVKKRTSGESESMIEEFMLLANQCAAHFARVKQIPFVYRVHEEPNAEKLERLHALLQACGINDHFAKEVPTPKELSAILEGVRGTPYEQIINTGMLRCMSKALYEEKPKGHYGLVLKDYAHFTSPIRRYPDLAIHRIMTDLLKGTEKETMILRYTDFAERASKQSSEREVVAMQIERKAEDCYKAEYARRHLGECYEGTISGVTQRGLFIELDNGVEGFVPASSLTPSGTSLTEGVRLTDPASGKSWSLGDKMMITIVRADVNLGKIDFEVAPAAKN
ncbi:MAG: ribonuclease R [Faecalibacterium prausnitzii]|jgi:ribonuclease R|uniref:Ribonuclease R n=1 Tax=Faecalibacterium butyricigenerans TaxID=1851427 RepID=A0ABS8F7D8_9FIRM|nr:ribonuclease R [Faecalibacterium sp. CLA-AA-H233]MBS7083110.1 ribonuclease R [Faecalibacterium prausnitzii]MCC2199150.1 ribonuclease R [Faecalibacterium sp. CLA-AA-H233]OLA32521.1 MAG: ribonuclease R [Faecalibacterium prausnitzii]